jgi:peptidoglycan-associated lipoprotein
MMAKKFVYYRFGWCVLGLMLAIGQVGCKGLEYPNCKTDSQCKVGNGADVKSGVCVFGKCQECAKDTDCREGQQCKDNMCVMTCIDDTMCGNSAHCENGFCAANCEDNSFCKDDEICSSGRCVASITCSQSTDCQTGFKCESGLCVQSSTEDMASSSKCPQENIIFFDFNKYDLRSESIVILDQWGICLRESPSVKVTIAGHTDKQGSSEYNMSLGERRARATSNYLSKLGVDESRIHYVSYGLEKPLDSADTQEAYAKNRRSEISIE